VVQASAVVALVLGVDGETLDVVGLVLVGLDRYAVEFCVGRGLIPVPVFAY